MQAALKSHTLLQFHSDELPLRGQLIPAVQLWNAQPLMLPGCLRQQQLVWDAPVNSAWLAGWTRRASLVSMLHMLSSARDTTLPHQPPDIQSCSLPDSDSCRQLPALVSLSHVLIRQPKGCLPVCRLWRSLAEHALSVRDFATADKAFVRCADFQVGQLLLHLTQVGEADAVTVVAMATQAMPACPAACLHQLYRMVDHTWLAPAACLAGCQPSLQHTRQRPQEPVPLPCRASNL